MTPNECQSTIALRVPLGRLHSETMTSGASDEKQATDFDEKKPEEFTDFEKPEDELPPEMRKFYTEMNEYFDLYGSLPPQSTTSRQ